MSCFIWAMFYQAVCAMQFHPGTKVRMTPDECAKVTDAMFREYRERWPEE